jgi:2-desacetyl-2-hydroxyethyl bacteriochlorophyllide A dehydrogenase
MRAVVVEDVDRVAVRDVPDPVVAGRALVRIERAGLCGTDTKIVAGVIPVRHPLVIGHEMVGRIVAEGPAGLLPTGTLVLIDPGEECGHCKVCRADRGYLCPTGTLRGRDADGGFAELMAVDERRLHPVPDAVALDEAAVLQVLATCVHAQTLVEVFPGQSAVVVGLGVAGLLHVQLLRERGITNIVAITRSAWKRELALTMGATLVATPDEASNVVAAATDGLGADLVVESVGQPSTLRQAIDLAGAAASVLVFGTVAGTTELATYQWYFKELTIVNARAARPRDYARAVQLAAAGRLRLAPLVTARFPMEEAGDAFEACRSGAHLKVLLQIA